MNKLTLLSRHSTTQKPYICSTLYLKRNLTDKKIPPDTSSSSSSNSSSDSDTDRKLHKNEAAKKLNLLLQDMINRKVVSTTPVQLPKPRRQREIKTEKDVEVKVQSVEKKVIESAKEVAQSLGGDVKQTESELLAKLLSTSSKVGEQQSSTLNLSEIIKGMKIDKDKKISQATSRANQVRNILQQSRKDDKSGYKEAKKRSSFETNGDKVEKTETIDLFGSKPLGYFQPSELYEDGPELKTWQQLQERELRLAVTHPPANYFQQMILWTEQGKIWKFPIDNEQGLEEEKKIYFTEHVFLEKHLEPWCPSKGPIKQFMELVCVGLSKNPYMSVTDKKNHIAWYRDYFADKQKLLSEIGALPKDFKPEAIPKITET